MKNIFSYLTITNEVIQFQETQVPRLLEAGFSENKIVTEVIPIEPEIGCRYYEHKFMIAPRCQKC